MTNTIYRIEQLNGEVYWTLNKELGTNEVVSFTCTFEEFLELNGEVTKDELKEVLRELYAKAMPLPRPKNTLGRPEKITHTNALQMLQHFEQDSFNAELLGVTTKEAEQMFQIILAESMEMIDGIKMKLLLDTVREIEEDKEN